MSYAARLRQLYPFKAPSASVDHLVIGGGVIGLSVAAGLVNTAGPRTTYLVERRGQLGQEVTARNSEVIHSGESAGDRRDSADCQASSEPVLAVHSLTRSYPIGSLKSKLCVRGRNLLYDRCAKLNIGHKKTEKVEHLDKLQTQTAHPSLSNGKPSSPYESNSVIPTYFLGADEARELEPDLSPDLVAALLVTEAGIVDSQGLVDTLEREIQEEDYIGDTGVGVGLASGKNKNIERGEGVIVLGTRVVRVDKAEKGKGWVVQLETGWEGKEEGEKGEVESVHADVVVNASGLNSATLLDGVVPESEVPTMYPIKGTYLSYKGPGVENISRLIYPCPWKNLATLGIHLTLDLAGGIKFGPDAESIGDPKLSRENPDFWQNHLAPSTDPERMAKFAEAIHTYLPQVDPDHLEPDYAGIRPNVNAPGSGFHDFIIRHHPDRHGLIELLAFASPGLTSSLAVGEYVSNLVRKEVWKENASIEELAEGWDQ